MFTPKSRDAERAVGRGGRLRHLGHQGARGRARGRHGDPRGPARGERLAGFQGDQAAGVRRTLSGRVQPVRGAARGAAEAEAQRLVAAVRAGSLAGARLRFPLRLPRPAAHGHRPGAARARVRHGADHDRADRGLRGAHAATASWSRIENPAKMPDPSKIAEIREPIITVTIFVPQDYVGAGDHARHRQARRAEEHAVPRAAGDAHLRDAAERDRHGLLRQAEVGRRAATPRSTTSSRSSARPTW